MAKRINPAFGQKVRAAREARGLTQQSLAEQSGTPLGTLREIEQGRREPLFGAMQRLAAALQVPLTDFPPTTDGEVPTDSSAEVAAQPAPKRGRPRKAEPPADDAGAKKKGGGK